MERKKDIQEIDNIELVFITIADYDEIKAAMLEAYANMENAYWKKNHIESLLKNFPEGQVAIKVDNELAGCALSIIMNYGSFDNKHTYSEITEIIH